MPEFEWDELKRAINLRKHGLDLSDARVLFDGRRLIRTPSRFPGEERFVTTGEIDGRY
jgi:uncharacterized DUF497 family protein